MLLCYLYTFTRKRRTILFVSYISSVEKGEPFWPAHKYEYFDLTMQDEIQLQLCENFKKSSIKKSYITAGIRQSSRGKYVM